MRATITTLALLALGLGVGCDDAPSPPPAPSIHDPAAASDLVALLPSSTLAAIELNDVAGRWTELRKIPRLARLQDRLLGQLGLDPDDPPAILGERAVLAFVLDDAARRRILPVAVLDPPSKADALARLTRNGKLSAVEARGAVWAGSAERSSQLEPMAAGDGTSFRQTVNLTALEERVPGGGLVRATINLGVLRAHLKARAEVEGSSPAGTIASLLRASLEPVRTLGFRRDVIAGEIVTDVWIGFDTELVPPAVSEAMATQRSPAKLPADLPPDAVLVSSFRLEAEAGLVWLYAMADRDPHGPLRNFEFWVDEFEARTGHDVVRDIAGALGEHGLALVLESEVGRGIELAAILEAREPGRLEAAMIDLRDWLGEQVWGRSLGLAVPRSRESGDRYGLVHGIEFRVPFGTVTGPVFQLAGPRLIMATTPRSLDVAAALAASADSWITPGWSLADGRLPDEVTVLRATALGRLLTSGRAGSGDDGWPLQAIGEFLDGAGDARLAAFWESEGFRLAGRLRIDG